MNRSRRRADAWLVLLAALLAARFAWLAPRLLVDDLNLDYPFAAGDAWDWIANGLWYAGEDVRFSARPPLVPLAMAGLAKLGALEAFPLVVQALWTVTLLVLYRLLRRGFLPPTAFAATLVVAASHTLNLLSLEPMADLPAACLLLLAVGALAVAAERPRWYLAAGGLAALASLASPIGLAAAAAGAAAVALRRRRHVREPALWGGAVLVTVCAGGWALARRAIVDPDHPLRDTARLLRPHLDDLDGTLWTAAVVAGWPALLLAVVGTVAAVRRVARRRDPDDLRLLALVATLLPLAFFALLYGFPDRRFLVYPALPAAVLVGEGLAVVGRVGERWKGRPERARAPAAAAGGLIAALAASMAVVWAAWPVPSPVPHSVLVAPPALYAQARFFGTREGGLRVEPAIAGLRLRAGREVAFSSWWSRVARARAAGEVEPRERAAQRTGSERARRAASGAAGVLFVDAGWRTDRYRVQSQLGNALGRRVRYVPHRLFAGRWDWLAAGGVEAIGEVGGQTLWTVAPPGLPGRWLLATTAMPPRESPPPASAEARTRPAPEGPPATRGPSGGGIVITPPADLRALLATPAGETARVPRGAAPPPGRAQARRLAAALPGRTRRVALLLPEGPVPPLAVWLPFLLGTTELYVVEEAGPPPVDRLFTPAPGAAARRFGAARLLERRWRGEPVGVIDFPR